MPTLTTSISEAPPPELRRWQLLHSTSTSSSPPPSSDSGSDDHRPLQQQHWSSFDSSVNAVSFGFVATAILISMFLVMAIFERFLRPSSPTPPSSSSSRRVPRQGPDSDSGPPPGFNQLLLPPGFSPKLGFPSPKMTVYTKGVSVLMPGEEFPTFIAHPVPVQCPPERISWPTVHHQNQYWNHSPLNANRNSSNRHHSS